MDNNKKIPLVVVCGPTASGKTQFAIDLAKRLNGEIISADSMQVYRDFQIITARPTEEEQCGIPHHLMGIIGLEESFSLADFLKLARAAAEDIFSRGRLPILCGGTGLYISSLIENVTLSQNASDPKLRAELEEFVRENGTMPLWQELEKLDPAAAARIHPNNGIRVIRAMELYRASGMTPTEHNAASRTDETPYECLLYQPSFHDRSELYDRINRRVDVMARLGMAEEARRVYESSAPATAAQAIGYKELIPYLENKASLEECIERIKLSTRRYAKRQLTWFRRMNNITKIYISEPDEYKKILEKVSNTIAKSENMCYNSSKHNKSAENI